MNYKMIQIPEYAHSELKQYCKDNNKKMGKEAADIILKEIRSRSKPYKVLKVKS